MEKQKTPISIILIIIWMGVSAFGILIKQFTFERISMSAQFLGESLSIANYIFDWIILVIFVIFIFMFFKRKKQVNKYFMFFVLFLVLGDLIGFTLGALNMSGVEKVAPYLQDVPQSFFIVVSIIGLIINLAIYFLIIYYTRKHKQHFSR